MHEYEAYIARACKASRTAAMQRYRDLTSVECDGDQMKPEEPQSYWHILIRKLEADWYEITHLGFAVRVKYAYQVVRYHLGLRKEPVDREWEFPLWDFDFDVFPERDRGNRILAIVYASILVILLVVSAGLALAGEAPCQPEQVQVSVFPFNGSHAMSANK